MIKGILRCTRSMIMPTKTMQLLQPEGNRRNYLELDEFKVDEFFGREAELQKLKNIFENSPNTSMYLFHGPPNCGKSRVIRQYLERSVVPFLSFDLRGNRLMSSEDLLEGINKIAETAMDTAYLTELMSKSASKYKMSLSKIKLSTELRDAVGDAESRIREAKDAMGKIYAAADAYDKLSFYFEGRSRPLLFFLDEVARIKEIVPKQVESTQAFRDLVSCLIRITKQERLGNALFSTTDPFFNLFLHSLGFPLDYFQRLTMGFMNETDMKAYLRQCYPGANEEITDIIWKTVGGNVQHFLRYALSSEFKNKLTTADEHTAASGEMIRLHYSSVIRTNFSLVGSADACTGLTKIYRELALSKHGALNYQEVAKDLGRELVDDLIKLGVIYLLSGEYISTDIVKADDEDIIIANSPLDLITMKNYFDI